MTKTVSAVEARHNLGHLLNLVSLTHTQVTIERAGKKIATLSEYKEAGETRACIPGGKLNLCEIEGLGKEIWADVDVAEYIRGGACIMGLTITPNATYALDTAPLIYLIEQNPEYIDTVRTFSERAPLQHCTLITSLITYIEVLTLPEKLGNHRLAAKYRAYLTNSENLALFPINIPVADRTVFFRSKYGFKTPDAIQLAVADVAGADAFLTNDSHLKQCSELPVYLLTDL